MGKSPFSIVYSCLPKHELDLVPLPKLCGVSIAPENMASRIQAIQDEVHKQLEESSSKSKKAADKKRLEKVFNKWDLEVVYVRKGRFPIGIYNKLKDRKYDPY